jgi:plastocyanin
MVAPGAAQAAVTTVNLANKQFTPSDVTINPGDTITWSFNDLKLLRKAKGSAQAAINAGSAAGTQSVAGTLKS